MNDSGRIIICGVGGQGILLASDLLCGYLMSRGLDVKKSEVHGMAQRGGSVVTHVTWGTRVFAPLIGRGECDLILSFELIESLRWLEYLREGGTLITSRYTINPISNKNLKFQYPESKLAAVASAHDWQVYFTDMSELKGDVINLKSANIFMMGILSKLIDSSVPDWYNIIKSRVPGKYIEMNLKAFDSGRTAVLGKPSL